MWRNPSWHAVARRAVALRGAAGVTLLGRPALVAGPRLVAARLVAAVAEPSAATGQQGAGTPASTATSSDSPKKEPMGWGRFWLYVTGAVSGITFAYYFHKAKYNLHKTELLLLDRWKRLPLYPPPGPTAAEQNTTIDPHGLPHDLVAAFSEWFVANDLREAAGVTRDDVIELLVEFGFSEEDKKIKDFIYRGEGSVEERRRMTGAGLQESVHLLAMLALPEEMEDHGTDPKFHKEAIEVLKRKQQGASSVMDGASVLQRALQFAPADVAPAPVPAGRSVPASHSSEGSALGTPRTYPNAADIESQQTGHLDEDQELQLQASRLQRIEDGLVARLERLGSLSPAEEGRLQDIRDQRAALVSDAERRRAT